MSGETYGEGDIKERSLSDLLLQLRDEAIKEALNKAINDSLNDAIYAIMYETICFYYLRGVYMEKRESERIEFKKSTSELKQGIISLSSMLNKGGEGTLYFGILNDSSICGQEIGKDTTHDISVAIKNHLRPLVTPIVKVKEEGEKRYIKVSVKGTDVPYSAYGRYYIRSDDEDLVMDEGTLRRMFESKEIDYSKWENELTQYGLEAVDEERLIRYFNEASDCGRINYVYKDPRDSLTKLGLFKEDRLNNAGLYLFSSIKPLKLKLAQFNSDERLSFSDIRLVEGNIFDCIEEGISYISNAMKWRGEIIGAKRQETPEIPLEAIREIVVNSFAHMKVIPGVLNEIYFTPSELRIINPGNIALGIDPKDFACGKRGPILRNPLIAMTLYKNRTIDSFATGFGRAFRLSEERNIKYSYSSDEVSFSFSFHRSKDSNSEADEAIKEALNEAINKVRLKPRGKNMIPYSEMIMNELRIYPNLTREDLALRLKTSESTIYRELREMQRNKKIVRVGSKKTGYWKIL